MILPGTIRSHRDGNATFRMVVRAVVLLSVWLGMSLPLPPAVLAQDVSVDQQYRLAAGFYSRAQWQEAADAFEKLLTDHPDSEHVPTVMFFRAEAQMQMGKFEPAYEGFQQYLRDYPNDAIAPRAIFRMGEGAFRTGRYDVAIRLLEEFVQQNPDDSLCQFALPYLGQLRLRRDEPQLAQRAFETTLRVHPNGALVDSARLGLAKSLQRLGQVDDARRFFEFLLENPDDDLVGEAQLQLGILSFDQQQLEEAESWFKQTRQTTQHPEVQAKANHWTAKIRIEQKQPASALEILTPLISQPLDKPLAVAVLLDAAIAGVALEKFDLALDWLQQIREHHPDSRLLERSVPLEIDVLQNQNQLEQAILLATKYRLELRLPGLVQQQRENRGRELYDSGRYRDSAGVYSGLIEEFPDADGVRRWRYLMSLAWLNDENYRAAEAALAGISEPAEPDELSALMALARGNARFGLKQYATAIADYEVYLNHQPDSDASNQARCELAICLIHQDQLERAHELLQELAVGSINSRKHDTVSIEAAAELLASRALKKSKTELAEHWLNFLSRNGSSEEIQMRAATRLAFADPTDQDVANLSVDKLAAAIERILLQRTVQPHVVRGAVQTTLARAHQMESRDPESATRFYELVVQHCDQPDLINVARVRLARIFQSSGEAAKLRQAQQMLQRYLLVRDQAAKPLADEVQYQLGWLAVDLGDTEAGYRCFQNVVDQYPESKYWPDAAYRLAQQRLSRGHKSEAAALLKQLGENADTPQEVAIRSRFLWGAILSSQQQWKQLETCMRGLDRYHLEPVLRAEADYWLAESAYRQNRFRDAEQQFLATLQNGSLNDKHRPWAKLRYAQCLAQADRWDSVAQVAQEALDTDPDFEHSHEFHFLMGRSQEAKGLLSDAREHYQEVISSDRAKGSELAAMAQWRIGETWFHQEDFANAIKAYYRVDSLHDVPKWRSAALLQAGKCQEHLKNPANAAKLYQQLLKKFPDSEFVSEARARLSQLPGQVRTSSITPQPAMGR